MNVAQVLEHVREVDSRAAVGDLHMAPAFEWSEQHEQVGGAIALVLVIVARRLAWLHWHRRARLGDELLGCLVEAHERPGWIVGAGVDLEGIFHGSHELGVGLGRDHPVLLQVRLEAVFFNARPTVLKGAACTISRSTTAFASRRMVQRA